VAVLLSIVKEPTATTESSQALVAPSRGLASVENVVPESKTIGLSDVVIDCSKKTEALEVSSKRVRFLGKNCDLKSQQDVSLVNNSNGFSASFIFNLRESFTTDFVDVKAGENNFIFSAQTNSGKRIEDSFKILVRSSKSQ
jgi:hypothetical protein